MKMTLLLVLMLVLQAAVGQGFKLESTAVLDREAQNGDALLQRAARAVKLLNHVVNTPEFRKAVEYKDNYSFSRLKNKRYYPNPLTGPQIYTILFSGKQHHIAINICTDEQINKLKKKTNTLGSTTLKQFKTTSMIWWMPENETIATRLYAAHLLHEYCHMYGFSDRKRKASKHRNVVPYAIGDIMKDLLEKGVYDTFMQ